jgi:cytochrome P450 family 2 subfamily D
MFSVPLLQLKKSCGDMFSLHMGWKPMVMIKGLKSVQDVLVTCGEDTADCPKIPVFHYIGCGPKAKGKMQCGNRHGIRVTHRGQ